MKSTKHTTGATLSTVVNLYLKGSTSCLGCTLSATEGSQESLVISVDQCFERLTSVAAVNITTGQCFLALCIISARKLFFSKCTWAST